MPKVRRKFDIQDSQTRIFLFSFVLTSDVWRLVYLCFLVPYLTSILNANYWQVLCICAGGIVFSKFSEWVATRSFLKDHRAQWFVGLSLVSLLARIVIFTIHFWMPSNIDESNLSAILVALCFSVLAQLSTRLPLSLSSRLRPQYNRGMGPIFDFSIFFHHFLAFAIAASILLAYLRLFPFSEQSFYRGAFVAIDASCVISSIFIIVGLSFRRGTEARLSVANNQKDNSNTPNSLAFCSTIARRKSVFLELSSFLFSIVTHSFFYFAIEWYAFHSFTDNPESIPIPSVLDISAATQVYIIMLFVGAGAFLIQLPFVYCIERSPNIQHKFYFSWGIVLFFAAPIVAAFFILAYSSNQLLIDIAYMVVGLSYVTLVDIVGYLTRNLRRILNVGNSEAIQGMNSMFSFWTWLGELFAIIISSIIPPFGGYFWLFLVDGILASLGWILLVVSCSLANKSRKNPTETKLAKRDVFIRLT